MSPEVESFLKEKNHPLTTEIKAVSDIILGVHPDVTDVVKWSSPTFVYKGNMASFFMNAKKHVSLMFHKGAFLNDTTGLLEGDGKEGRVAKFSDLDDIAQKRERLIALVQLWIDYRDSSG